MKNRSTVRNALACFLAVLCAGSLLVCNAPLSASAATSQELQKQVSDLKDDKKDIDAKIKALEKKISGTNTKIKSIQTEKEAIDQQIALIAEEVENLNSQIATYSQLLADKQAEVVEAQAELNRLNEKHKERIRAMEEDGNMTYWSVLFKANSFADLLDRLTIVDEIAAADRQRLQEMSDAAKVLADAKAELQADKDELQSGADELAATQEQLAQKREQSDSLLSQLNAQGEEYEALLEEQEDEQAAILQSIAQAEKAYDAQKLKEMLGSTPSDTGWIVPCSYIRLSSPFGYRIHPISGVYKMHYGVDLAGKTGTPIKAARSGVVTAATYNSSCGNYVTINHGDGFSSIYMHMTNSIVSVGTVVTQGQVIGYMGSTGASTGPHLHFGISKNGTYVNPANYISIQ